LYLAGPPLVQAAIGEIIDAESLGGAHTHNAISGVADDQAHTEAEAIQKMRAYVGDLPPKARHTRALPIPEEDPLMETLLRSDPRYQQDNAAIVERLADPTSLRWFKPHYGPTLLCAFGTVGGHPVGILANQGILHPECAKKAVQFVAHGVRRQIPLIFLQDVTGFMVGRQAEHAGIAKEGARMLMAVANANVPKYTILIGASMGAGNYAMCGRSLQGDFLWAWPNATIGIMGGAQADFVLSSLGKEIPELRASYHESQQALYGTSRLWDDGILAPAKTRATLIQVLNLRPIRHD
jgi:3-methylcrotonyl-CoA carboxylase beta subunit